MAEQWTLNTTNVFSRNLRAYLDGKRLIVNQGGTSSSKTFSIMQLLVLVALYTTSKLLISVVSESIPHLKRGCIRDLENILGSNWQRERFNKTDHIYSFDNATMEFFPADDSTKLRGGRRDILYINEANNISKSAYDELDVRTKKCSVVDYNPVSEFYVHEILSRNDPSTAYIHSTYLDAKHVLPPDVVAKIEARRATDPNWWRVYGLGEIGNIEGLVFPLFAQVDEMPQGGAEFYGLDFGYTNDPTALVKCLVRGNELYCDQLIYETGLKNDQIARRMESLGIRKGYDEVFADAAEPKSIDEIRSYGYNVKPATKGPDSVIAGVQKVNQFVQFWTKRSIDGIKEQRNHRFIQTVDGKYTNKPMDDYNHLMDARRYAVFTKYGEVKGRGARIAI